LEKKGVLGFTLASNHSDEIEFLFVVVRQPIIGAALGYGNRKEESWDTREWPPKCLHGAQELTNPVGLSVA
jgi:hypothetical protein